jgi:hypothetical protein
MNRADVIRMAREADIHVSENNSFADDMYISTLYRFANVVAAAERKAICRLVQDMWCGIDADRMVDAIRARGNT